MLAPQTVAATHATINDASVARFIGELVRIPSRDGRDAPHPIVDALSDWLSRHEVPHRILRDRRDIPIGIWGSLEGTQPGAAILLNATIDTAPFGDPSTWTVPPAEGRVRDGWLWGRGAADSKAGVAIFAGLVAETARTREGMAGRLEFLFDFGEHGGRFTGVRAYVADRTAVARSLGATAQPLDGVYIGYPGNSRIITGCRGFLRIVLEVPGVAAHTGSSRKRGVNAISRAAGLVRRLDALPLPPEHSPEFPIPGRLSVTRIVGGESYSIVPDRCRVHVDVRLTRTFEREEALALVRGAASEVDAESPELPPIRLRALPGLPAYHVTNDHPIVNALANGARQAFGSDVPTGVAGPSSVGNYFAQLGVPAVSGFGVTYENLHAANERIELRSIAPTLHAYRAALQQLLPRDPQ